MLTFKQRRNRTLAATISLLLSTAAAAQNATVQLDEVVVVGSRGTPRLVTESSSPIGLIDGDQLRSTGLNDLSKALQFLAPSVNFPRSATGPSAANTRGVTLRGLSPDQVLRNGCSALNCVRGRWRMRSSARLMATLGSPSRLTLSSQYQCSVIGCFATGSSTNCRLPPRSPAGKRFETCDTLCSG